MSSLCILVCLASESKVLAGRQYGRLQLREREFISLLIMNDSHKKISIIPVYRRIVKLATGSCEGTIGVKSILKLYLSKSIVTDGKTTISKVESID